jgi:hypothetical protein
LGWKTNSSGRVERLATSARQYYFDIHKNILTWNSVKPILAIDSINIETK